MRSILIQVFGQVNNCNCFERALLDADTATDAQRLADQSRLGILIYFNAQFAYWGNYFNEKYF